MGKIKYTEVPFDIMLRCDGEIMCECWLLNNSLTRYGIDLKQPMMFNTFIHHIGKYLSSINCSMLFQQAKWYVIDDGIQPEFYIKRSVHNER